MNMLALPLSILLSKNSQLEDPKCNQNHPDYFLLKDLDRNVK